MALGYICAKTDEHLEQKVSFQLLNHGKIFLTVCSIEKATTKCFLENICRSSTCREDGQQWEVGAHQAIITKVSTTEHTPANKGVDRKFLL